MDVKEYQMLMKDFIKGKKNSYFPGFTSKLLGIVLGIEILENKKGAII